MAAPRRALQVRALWGKGDGEGKGGFGGVGNLMESMKQAQALVQGEAGRIQQELAECAAHPLQPRTMPSAIVSDPLASTATCARSTVA